MELISLITEFGLTRQEATIYLVLHTDGELTGYEAAKLTGISRSNTYTALAGLVDKGAAYVLEGSVAKYTPVKFDEFSNNYLHRLQVSKETILSALPSRRKESDGYITIRGEHHIMDKIRNMLLETEYRVYTSLPMNILAVFQNELAALIEKGIKVVVLISQPYSLDGAIVYQTKHTTNQIRLIIDSTKVLTGEITDKEDSNCLYSENNNLVNVFKDMLQNEITLIELTK